MTDGWTRLGFGLVGLSRMASAGNLLFYIEIDDFPNEMMLIGVGLAAAADGRRIVRGTQCRLRVETLRTLQESRGTCCWFRMISVPSVISALPHVVRPEILVDARPRASVCWAWARCNRRAHSCSPHAEPSLRCRVGQVLQEMSGSRPTPPIHAS